MNPFYSYSANPIWETITGTLKCVVAICVAGGTVWGDVADSVMTARIETFGVQLFRPVSGFVLRRGQELPDLVWEHPDTVAGMVDDPSIETRWFDADLNEVRRADRAGRYFAFGEATGPTGIPFRRGMTCVSVDEDVDLAMLARGWGVASTEVDSVVQGWGWTEKGAVELAGLIESDGEPEPRLGQWMLENATRHVRLKRKIRGLGDPVTVEARQITTAAPVLRREAASIAGEQIQAIEERLDAWYEAVKQPTSIIVAVNGVIVVEKNYGEIDGRPVTTETPMLLHSAMKPLIGIQQAMYVDRGLIDIDEPLGNHLPEFDTDADRLLTFRAGHAHATGINFPWPLAFSRLFYFEPWHEGLIAHRGRDWEPGARHKYGVVGVILSVRAMELIRGLNYWDAMERDVFAPLGIDDMLPGGVGFSAEDLARLGVMLQNRGRYGNVELYGEETHEAIVPTSLTPYFPEIDKKYGFGIQSYDERFGEGSYGHAGGCGTQLTVFPKEKIVFSMVRNERGEDYKAYLAEVMALARGLGR